MLLRKMILFFLLLKLLFPSPVILLFSLLLASNDQLRHAKNLPSSSFKFYRNVVNRERKSCKASFYKVKVEHMKDENPKLWWKEVKRLSGSQSNSGNVINHIHIEEIEDFNNQELANIINKAFPEPLEEYRLEQPLTKFPVPTDSPKLHEISELTIMKLLATLNPSKACSPDEIPNCCGFLKGMLSCWLSQSLKSSTLRLKDSVSRRSGSSLMSHHCQR